MNVMQVDLREQAEVAELLREPITSFLERNASRESVAAIEREEDGFSRAHWEDLAKIGCASLLMPDEHSGTTHGLLVLASVVELLGAYSLPTPIFATAVDAASLITRAAADPVRDQLLEPLASGKEIAAVAFHEPGASPPAAVEDLQTIALEVRGRWLLRGVKVYVPYAHVAERLLCVARVGESNCAIFVVPRSAAGVRLTRLRTTNSDPLFEVALDDVSVGGDDLLGGQGDSWRHVTAAFDVGAALKCSELLGIGRRVVELTRELVQQRVQFDQPIGAFQAVQHHLVDMFRLVEQTRVLTEQAVLLLDNGFSAEREVSLAKIKASEGMLTVLNLAHQLHGGVGYYDDYPLETLFRRTMAAQGAYGSARWHRARLETLLIERPQAFLHRGAHDLGFRQ
jgi:3-oxocholest-4-en-26-oyl-CoA dehydrogenase beta subunit